MILDETVAQAAGRGSRDRFRTERGLTPGGSMRQAAWFEPSPPYAVRGKGCYVEDVDGQRFLDVGNNFFSLVHGHAFPPVVEAVSKALEDGTAFALPTDREMSLADLIKERAPQIDQVRFCNSGSEAVMYAVKAARAITGRSKIAKFEGAYHGSYDFVEVSLNSEPGNWGARVPEATRYAAGTPQSVLDEVVVLPWNNAQMCTELIGSNGPELAAVLIDLIPSRIGMIPAEPGFLESVSKAARAAGALIVADEVISFRLGFGGASAIFGLEPDLTALAKVIGGGLPVGAVGGSAAMMQIYNHVDGQPAVPQGGTFSANPLTMAAGAACLAHLDEAAIARINGFGDRLRDGLNDHFAQNGIDAQVRGYGSLFRLHLTGASIRNYRDAFPSTRQGAAIKRIHRAIACQHVLLTPNCSGALSTAMSETEIETLISVMAGAVADNWSVL